MKRTGYINAATYSGPDRRSGKDRRKQGPGNYRWLFKSGQRRQLRRQADRRELHLLDSYPPELFHIIVMTLLLSFADALLTLYLIDHGAVELNPVMAYYLKHGSNTFFAVKYMLTAVAVTFVVLLNYFFVRMLRVNLGQMLKVFAGCFAMVVVWELYLVATLVI